MKNAWEKVLKQRGYKLRHTIGEGAYSKVKLAHSFDLKKDVAIKCIGFHDAPHDFLSKFLPRELSALTALHHKNVIHVYEVLEHYGRKIEDSFVCIVMEYAKNGDMLKYIQNVGALPEEDVKRYSKQLCQAIGYCHAKGLCHRDLKCENLLLGKNKKLILSDFGFCKPISLDSNGKVILSSTYCGSAAYAAPETLQGKPYNPLLHDMWSLGVIIFIMASGQMPFDDSNVGKMLKAQNQENINYLINSRCGGSKELKNLIKLLLQVDTRKRGTIRNALTHPFFSRSRISVHRKISPHHGVVYRNNSELKNPAPKCSRGVRSKKVLTLGRADSVQPYYDVDSIDDRSFSGWREELFKVARSYKAKTIRDSKKRTSESTSKKSSKKAKKKN